MYRIVKKEALKPTVILYEIEAPMVAKKAEPGQFIILRVDENGERIPITIHDYDREKGTVTIIVQTVGATTEKLSHKQQGECLHDFVGPLGKPTETEGKKKVCVVGGGVGCAIAYPVAKKLAASGKYDGIVAVGAVIRGGTPHFDFVAAEATKGLAHVSLESGVPVGFGLLTTDNIEQAIERAGTKAGNKGVEAASAVLETVRVLQQI